MEWSQIQRHYARLFTAAGLTQGQIAARGGLSGQDAVSKLLNNAHRGPSVETFARAVEGLGITLSEFFAALEPPPPPPPPPTVEDRLERVEAALSAVLATRTAPVVAVLPSAFGVGGSHVTSSSAPLRRSTDRASAPVPAERSSADVARAVAETFARLERDIDAFRALARMVSDRYPHADLDYDHAESRFADHTPSTKTA